MSALRLYASYCGLVSTASLLIFSRVLLSTNGMNISQQRCVEHLLQLHSMLMQACRGFVSTDSTLLSLVFVVMEGSDVL